MRSLLAMGITAPPDGAAAFRVTVPSTEVPVTGTALVGFSVRPETVTGGGGGGGGGGGADVQPMSDAAALVTPSLTVTLHVGELKLAVRILNRPPVSAVPRAVPSTLIGAFGWAPWPSTLSCPPLNSERVITMAAFA